MSVSEEYLWLWIIREKLATPQRSCCLVHCFFFFLFNLLLFVQLASFEGPFPWCVNRVLRWSQWEWNTCSTSYSFTLFDTFYWVGLTNLKYGKTKNKGFIVLYMHFQHLFRDSQGKTFIKISLAIFNSIVQLLKVCHMRVGVWLRSCYPKPAWPNLSFCGVKP